jgi:hypothetical protein
MSNDESYSDSHSKTVKQPSFLYRTISGLFKLIWEDIGCLILIGLLGFAFLYVFRSIRADSDKREAARNKQLVCTSEYKHEFKSGTILVDGKEITGLLKISENKGNPFVNYVADFQFLYPKGTSENKLDGANDNYSWNVSYREGNRLRSINIPNQVKFPKCDIDLLIQDFTAVVQEE